MAAASLALASITLAGVVSAEPPTGNGNRYTLDRAYKAEISSAKAYVDGVENRSTDPLPLQIVDVRDLDEHAAGHPPFSISASYPRIQRECVDDNRSEDGGSCIDGVVPDSTVTQNPEGFFLQVEAMLLDKSQRIGTMCRTGFRSVLAANILTLPEVYICTSVQKCGNDDEEDVDNYNPKYNSCVNKCAAKYRNRGYENVYNIWEGFVGRTKVDANGNEPLDLNNDGLIDAADKDGWRYYQQLPWVQ